MWPLLPYTDINTIPIENTVLSSRASRKKETNQGAFLTLFRFFHSNNSIYRAEPRNYAKFHKNQLQTHRVIVPQTCQCLQRNVCHRTSLLTLGSLSNSCSKLIHRYETNETRFIYGKIPVPRTRRVVLR